MVWSNDASRIWNARPVEAEPHRLNLIEGFFFAITDFWSSDELWFLLLWSILFKRLLAIIHACAVCTEIYYYQSKYFALMLDEWKNSTTFCNISLDYINDLCRDNWWPSPLVTQPDFLVTVDDFTFERHWVTKGRRHQLSLHEKRFYRFNSQMRWV